MLSVEQALQLLLAQASPSARVGFRPLGQARGLYVAEDLYSSVDVPPADNSAMDGYAVLSSAVSAGVGMPVSQRIAAGHEGTALVPGSVARIFTGAHLPSGADAVVMQEDCQLTDNGDVIIAGQVKPGQHVRPRGQDIARGQRLVQRGQRLGPPQLGLLAGSGLAGLPVFEPLTVALLSTGDELVEPGATPGPGQIFNSNRPMLTAMLEALGFRVADLGIVPDTLDATRLVLEEAARVADCVIATGGVSAGEEDHVRAALEQAGELSLWKLGIKPGKPLAFGRCAGVPFFGLPGNPASAFVTFALLARPFLLTLQGSNETQPEQWQLPAAFSWARPGSRQEYLRARIEDQGRGPEVHIYPNQSSGVLASVAWGNALAVIPPGQTVSPGQPVAVISLHALGIG